MGTRSSPLPRPRLLRPGQRQGLHTAADHDRLRIKKRHRLLLKISRRKKLIHDKIKGRGFCDKNICGGDIHKIVSLDGTHGQLKIVNLFRQQTGVISKVILIQILRQRLKSQRNVIIRSINRFRGEIVRQRHALIFSDSVLQAGRQRQKFLQRDIYRRILFRQHRQKLIRQLQVIRIL